MALGSLVNSMINYNTEAYKKSSKSSLSTNIGYWTSGMYKDDELVREKLNLYHKKYRDNYQNFNRYYDIYPELELGDLRPYVFFTRPDCNLCTMKGKQLMLNEYASLDPTWKYYFKYRNIILQSLTSYLHPDHDFVPFLQGAVKSCQIPDINIKSYQMTQLYTGYQYQYAGNSIESTTGGTFDVTFKEDHLLRILQFFDMWIKYMNDVQLNKLKPKKEYIYDNQADYMASTYIFLCDPTAQNIVYFAKYTGIFPLNANHSNISPALRGTVDNEITVTFAYSHFEAFNPLIIKDFNSNSRKHGKGVPHYDEKLGRGEMITGAPWIRNLNGYLYELMWNKKYYVEDDKEIRYNDK